ncbi:MAG: Osmosensitive channel His kinase sensor domain [Gammaproteobacteria bacterium]|nr:Osmosensitive channel His kinase sensor domain [Gammaproteobacteria bacterium]
MTAMRVMLETAVAAKKTGADIVVGLVSSSGCDPLDRLLRCFDHLPGSGRPLSKKHEANAIDLNAVRKRIPGILLVDMRPSPKCDAARVPGSARPDDSLAAIEDIIASGIDVWAAVDATGLSSWASVGVGVPRQISGVSLL